MPVMETVDREFLDSDPVLRKIVDGVLSVADPEKIVLFGSRARGEAGPDSDYDVLVVEPRAPGAGTARRSGTIRLAIGSVNASVDVLLATPEEMNRWRLSPLHVLADAQREGRVLHQR